MVTSAAEMLEVELTLTVEVRLPVVLAQWLNEAMPMLAIALPLPEAEIVLDSEYTVHSDATIVDEVEASKVV